MRQVAGVQPQAVRTEAGERRAREVALRLDLAASVTQGGEGGRARAERVRDRVRLWCIGLDGSDRLERTSPIRRASIAGTPVR